MTVKSASDHPFSHVCVFVCVSGGSLTSGQLLRAFPQGKAFHFFAPFCYNYLDNQQGIPMPTSQFGSRFAQQSLIESANAEAMCAPIQINHVHSIASLSYQQATYHKLYWRCHKSPSGHDP